VADSGLVSASVGSFWAHWALGDQSPQSLRMVSDATPEASHLPAHVVASQPDVRLAWDHDTGRAAPESGERSNDDEEGEEEWEEGEEAEEEEEEEDYEPMLGCVEIRESRHGGLGLFALKDFEKGDLVIREIPFVAIKHLPWEDVEQRLDQQSESSQMIRSAVEALDADNAALYWKFTQTDLYGELKTPQGVFWTNMIELYKNVEDDEEDQDGTSCMFEVTSRMNHSCSPSVEWVSITEIPLLDSVAVRAIKEGEEIFVSYKTSGGHEETIERRQYLKTWYGFDCFCRHCTAYLSRYNIPA
jgi:hypothetical protein